MKKAIWILAVLLAACSTKPSNTLEENSMTQDSVEEDVPRDSTSEESSPPMFEYLGLTVGMDSAKASLQIESLKKDGILGAPTSIDGPNGESLSGFEYVLKTEYFDGKAVWVTHYYDGLLGMIDLHFIEGGEDREALKEFLESEYVEWHVEKEGDYIWLNEDGQMRATDQDVMGRNHLFWLHGPFNQVPQVRW